MPRLNFSTAFTLLLTASVGLGAHVVAAQEAAVPAAKGEATYLPEPDPVPPPVVVGQTKQIVKYEDGNVRLEYDVLKLSNDQYVNNGLFTEYYPTGQKFAEGHYVNGVHDGPWTFWYENSQVCKVVNFKQGRADGAWDVFRPDGTLLAKKVYKDNKRHGDWVTYQEDGKTPKVEETFVDGIRDGVSRAYFPNGKPQREVTFKNNLIEGLLTEWDDTGRKLGEVNFKNGKRDGKMILYREDGTKIEHDYKEGRLLPGGAQG